MMSLLSYLIFGGILVALGWSLHGAVTEYRHHCMPHVVDMCRDTTGETR